MKAKDIYYPNLDKRALFPDYIATRSGHSRGATVDLTLKPRDAKPPKPDKVAARLHRAAEAVRRLTAALPWARASTAST